MSLPTGVTRGPMVLVEGEQEPGFAATMDVCCMWCDRTIFAGEVFTSAPRNNASRAPASDHRTPSIHPVCLACRAFEPEGRVYTMRPVPAIARVDFYEMNFGMSGEEHLRDLFQGSVRMTPDGHLECDPGMEDEIEDLRYDFAFGREWRRLTDAELLAHLPLRPMGYTWAEAYDADGNPVTWDYLG